MNKNSIILILLLGFTSSACSDNPDAESNVKAANLVTDKPQEAGNKQQGDDWHGPAFGYVHENGSSADRIELFIHFGQLLGAVSLYNMRAGEMRRVREPSADSISNGHSSIASIFNDSLLEHNQRLDSMVQRHARKTNTVLDIQDTLAGLNDNQQIIDISNGDRDRRDQQYAANQKVLLVSSRVLDAVISFYPSRREYLLASSALIRQAADKVAIAVSAKGIITNSSLLWDAYTMIDQTVKLDPKHVSYCDAQRQPIKAHKKAIDDLLKKMVPNTIGETITITATEVYALADQAQKYAERFTIDGREFCTQNG